VVSPSWLINDNVPFQSGPTVIRLKPLIFRVFNQTVNPKFPDFERFSDSLKIEDVGRFAQRLILHSSTTHTSTTQELEDFLSHCPNLQDLAIWLRPIKFLLPILEKLPLKRLSADFANLVHDDYLSSTFSNITHLDVVRFYGCTWKEWEVLSELPQLSHLIVGFLVDLDVLSNLLRYAAHLQVLIFMPGQEGVMERFDDDQHKICHIDNDRLVLLYSPQYPGLVEDWVKGGESGLDNWTFCKLISLARKRKFAFIGLILWLTCNHFLLL